MQCCRSRPRSQNRSASGFPSACWRVWSEHAKCISALDAEGWTTREIGQEMGISAASVCRLLKPHHRPMPPQVFGD
jgi:hypothetical protein